MRESQPPLGSGITGAGPTPFLLHRVARTVVVKIPRQHGPSHAVPDGSTTSGNNRTENSLRFGMARRKSHAQGTLKARSWHARWHLRGTLVRKTGDVVGQQPLSLARV